MPIPNANLKNVSFSTQFRYMQVFKKGQVNYTMGTNAFVNTTNITIPHGLTYKPFFRLWFKLPNRTQIYQMESGPRTYQLAGTELQIEGIGSDNTNIHVQMGSYDGTGGTGTIYYRIYEEPQQ